MSKPPYRPGLWPGSGPGSYQAGALAEAFAADAGPSKVKAGQASRKKTATHPFGVPNGTISGLGEKTARRRRIGKEE